MNAEAVNKAQELLEKAQADARKDFKLVNPVSMSDGIYQKSISVSQPDYFTKLLTAAVSWTGEYNRPQSVWLSSLVTDFENAVGGDTCSSVLSGDWTHPQIKNATTNFSQLIGGTSGTYRITDLDAYENNLYVTVNGSSQVKTFFILNASIPASPVLLGSLDNSPSVSAGLAAVAVAGNYGYVANGYGANFATCAQGDNCAQLQVIDIQDAAHPAVAANLKLPSGTNPFVSGHGGQATGKSIFYKDGYVYLGLSKTASGPEFNIIDVHNPAHPSWVGGYAIGSGVDSIYVKGRYAYLATDDTGRELVIVDVGDPFDPVLSGTYNAVPDVINFGYGNNLYSVGDRLYLARTYISKAPEFSILDASIPGANLPAALGARDIGSNSANPFSLNGIIVRGSLAFLLTGSGTKGGSLQVVDVSNPAAVATAALTASVSLPNGSGGIGGTALDCEGNYLYVGSVDAGMNGYVLVISGL